MSKTCGFCGVTIGPGEPRRYCYPLPEHCKARNSEGLTACLPCFEAALAQLLAEGKVEIFNPRPLHRLEVEDVVEH